MSRTGDVRFVGYRDGVEVRDLRVPDDVAEHHIMWWGDVPVAVDSVSLVCDDEVLATVRVGTPSPTDFPEGRSLVKFQYTSDCNSLKLSIWHDSRLPGTWKPSSIIVECDTTRAVSDSAVARFAEATSSGAFAEVRESRRQRRRDLLEVERTDKQIADLTVIHGEHLERIAEFEEELDMLRARKKACVERLTAAP